MSDNQYLVVYARSDAEVVDVGRMLTAYTDDPDTQAVYLVTRDGRVDDIEILDHEDGEYEVFVGDKLVDYVDYNEAAL